MKSTIEPWNAFLSLGEGGWHHFLDEDTETYTPGEEYADPLKVTQMQLVEHLGVGGGGG